jgi:hypothetical protein
VSWILLFGRLVDVETGVLVDAAKTQQDFEPTANFSLRVLKMVPVPETIFAA